MRSRLLALASVAAVVTTLLSAAGAGAITFDTIPFQRTWNYTDMPVAEGLVSRTWIWGPGPITAGMDERYAESPGGERRVQYFDKSRMEITHPEAPEDDLWYVTNGLLVVELATGQLQIGDSAFEAREPSQENVAGDRTDDLGSPTYATVGGLMDELARPVGDLIIERANRDGSTVDDQVYVNAGVIGAYLVPETGHVVASVFWDFLNSTGLVADDSTTYEGRLFPNPFYATGFPITEAYWATVPVGGVVRDVLWQCFQRRCLTYTPSNELGWQVEAGNVGRHYYHWRYGDLPVIEAQVYLVAVGDNGASGERFGCDDSLVPVTRPIDDSRGPIVGALEALLDIDEPQFGESGLSTALWNWDVTVDTVTVEAGLATVHLSGDYSIAGVCDQPRIELQLKRTVLQFPEVNEVEIFVNGQPLEEILTLQ